MTSGLSSNHPTRWSRAAWPVLRTRRGLLAAVFLFFLIATLLHFGPVIRQPNSTVLEGPNDAILMIAWYRTLEETGETPWTAEHNPFVAAPEGVRLAPSVQIVAPVQPAVVWSLKPLLGITGAFNLFLFSGFVLSGFAMFFLLDRLGINALASLFGAYVFAFNSWSVERALAGHAAFVHGWIYVVLVLLLLRMSERRSVLSAALVGLAFGASFLIASYVGLLSTLVMLCYFGLEFLRRRALPDLLWTFTLGSVTLAATIVLLLPGLIAYSSDRATVERTYEQGGGDRQQYGADLDSYLVPSERHPLFGEIARPFRETDVFAEQTLFFGFTTLLLAGCGFVLLLRKHRDLTTPNVRRLALTFAAILLPVALWASLRRVVHVLDVPIPTLSFFLEHVAAQYRVFARFGILVGLALVLLAAPALHLIMRRSRHGLAIGAIALALVAVELLPGRIVAWGAAGTPAYVSWLSDQPPGIAAEYPLPTDKKPALRLGSRSVYYTAFHRHPIYNVVSSGYGGTREHAIRLLTRYVTDPLTPGILAAEGVRYVILHDDVYRQQGEKPPELSAPFRLLEEFPNVRVYTLDAAVEPVDLDVTLEQNAASIALVQGISPPDVTYENGFSPPFSIAGEPGWRRIDGEGAIRISNEDLMLKRGLLVVTARNDGDPGTLQVLDPDQAVLAEAPISSGETVTTLGPIPLEQGANRLGLHFLDSAGQPSELTLAPLVVQPLADFSVSITD